MTNRERFMATLKGESADRIPVFPLLMFFAANRAGITYREYATNGKAMAEAQLRVQEQFDLDAITACSDAFRISADLGGDMVYPETNPPSAASPIVYGSLRSRTYSYTACLVTHNSICGNRSGSW
jgi:uroporphyrinogen-III decarboxylase